MEKETETDIGGMDTETDWWWEEYCSIIPPEPLRLVLVGLIGSAVCLVSLLFNSFLFFVLLANPRHRHSHFLYLMLLALFDVFISGSYILLFPVNLFMDFFESEVLAAAWWTYMRPMLALCHVAISTSALLLLAAAFERFLTISRIHIRQFTARNRMAICATALLFALLSKAPLFFEVKIVANSNCTGVTAHLATMAPWCQLEPYKTLYRFWFRNIITIFLPFFLLFYLNIQILRRLRQQHSSARLFRFATSEHRRNIRSATRMLVCVTCTYLASNLVNVIVSAWEFIDLDSLMTPQLRPLYTYSSDLVSFLTVVSSALRLPIYCACNARIRNEAIDALFRVCWVISGWPSMKRRSRPVYSTMRYTNTGNGLLIVCNAGDTNDVEQRNRRGGGGKFFGTRLDKVVLSLAVGTTLTRRESTSCPSRMNTLAITSEETLLDVDENTSATISL